MIRSKNWLWPEVATRRRRCCFLQPLLLLVMGLQIFCGCDYHILWYIAFLWLIFHFLKPCLIMSPYHILWLLISCDHSVVTKSRQTCIMFVQWDMAIESFSYYLAARWVWWTGKFTIQMCWVWSASCKAIIKRFNYSLNSLNKSSMTKHLWTPLNTFELPTCQLARPF